MFGFLNCDKPTGMTSRDVVNVVQRRLRKKAKVGHAGTLDPLADGVLVLGVGPAVRLVPYVQRQHKHYRGTFRLGAQSDSGDIESELQHPAGLPQPSLEDLQEAARGLVGRIEQVPPTFSAIHVDGKRAYERARAGETFEMPKREVDVYSLQVLRYEFPEVELEVACGSGTYIRSIGIDLAAATGTVAVMTQLRRTAIGPFLDSGSISIERLREDDLEKMLSSPALAVGGMPRVIVDDAMTRRLGHGLEIDAELIGDHDEPMETEEEEGFEAAALCEAGELRAIVRRKRGAWYPYRVFPVTD